MITYKPRDINYPYTVINSLSDFPDPDINGVINLQDHAYYIATNIDILGYTLKSESPIVIMGSSSEVSFIRKTISNSNPLLISKNTIILRDITLTSNVDDCLDLDGVSNALSAIDWFGVNFTDCANVGTIQNYSNFVGISMAFLNSGNLLFTGTFGTIAFDTILYNISAGTGILIDSSCIVQRRFRIIYSSFVAGSGEIALDVSTSASIPIEGYILDTVNFSGGGTYTQGVQYNDNKSLFSNCKGIKNSSEISYYTMSGNVTPTIVSSAGVTYKILGTTTSQPETEKFTNTDNRATYTGAITRNFRVTGIVTLTSGNNNQIGIYIAKNGTVSPRTESYITTGGTGRAEGGKVQGIFELAQNDYIEIFVENSTAVNNITVQDLSVIVEALN